MHAGAFVGFPPYCPYPTEDRCCLLSHSWPLCRPALLEASGSDRVKRLLLESTPTPPAVRQRIVIEYAAEDASQAASFYRGLTEFLNPITVVRITKVSQTDAPA